MTDRREIHEELLYAWMEMSLQIRGNRILSDFSFNEMMLYGMLQRRQSAGLPPISATELGSYTKLLKSQINHILTQMENRGLIRRERSTRDKRVVYVHPLEGALPRYEKEHEKVLQIVEHVFSVLGDNDAQTLTVLMRKATAAVNDHTLQEEP